MDKNQLYHRLIELGAEFITKHPNGDYTAFRNLPLGLGFINIYFELERYWFVEINWEVSNQRIPNEAEILTKL